LPVEFRRTISREEMASLPIRRREGELHLVTNSGSRDDIIPIVHRHTGADGLLLCADQVIE